MGRLSVQPAQPPLYQQVKEYIRNRITTCALRPGMKIESEAELVARLKVSRMTVNRALRELSGEGLLKRVQGRGTFVAEPKPQAALLEICSIATEIRARGGIYSCTVHLLDEEKAQPSVAYAMQLKPYSEVFHSIIVHKDRNVPIQLGCRYINPAIAPDFLTQDFSRMTVSDYLLSIAPVTAVEHIVEALIPDPWIRDLLQINAAEPCLSLHRKTWAGDRIATLSTFYSPGSRYTLGGTFTPTATGRLGVF